MGTTGEPPNTIILIIGTPRKGTPNGGKPKHVGQTLLETRTENEMDTGIV